MKVIYILLFLTTMQNLIAQNQNDAELIRVARQTSNQAIVKKDIKEIANFWLDDYVVITGRGLVERTKQANTEVWIKMLKESPETYFDRTPTEIIISKNNPNLAWESGVWKGFNTYSAGGKYSAQWKKIDGEWKLQAELFVALDK